MIKLKNKEHKIMMRGIEQLIQETRQKYRIYNEAFKNTDDKDEEDFFLRQLQDLSVALRVMDQMTGIAKAHFYMDEHARYMEGRK